jgi:hypothetical protein
MAAYVVLPVSVLVLCFPFNRRGNRPDTTSYRPWPPHNPLPSSGEPHTLLREHQQPPTTADAVHTPVTLYTRRHHECVLHCSRRGWHHSDNDTCSLSTAHAEGGNTHAQSHTNTPPSRVRPTHRTKSPHRCLPPTWSRIYPQTTTNKRRLEDGPSWVTSHRPGRIPICNDRARMPRSGLGHEKM